MLTLKWSLSRGSKADSCYYKNDTGRPHSKHSITKTEKFMLFREIITLYWENHIEHIHTLFGQNIMFLNVKASCIYSDHCALQS